MVSGMTGQTSSASESVLFDDLEAGTNTGALVRRIIQLVQSGRLPLGSRLPAERRLAELLKVSRPSIRQAIKALEAMGIVVCRVGDGNFITSKVTASNLLKEPMQFAIRANKISRRQLFEMREVIEVQVAGLTAARVDERALNAIRHELEEMERHRANPRLLAEKDYRFHLAIVQACGNPIFELLLEPVSALIWQELADRMHLFDPDVTVELHRKIFRAIESRDAAAAIAAMKEHLIIGYESVVAAEQAPAASGQSRQTATVA
jgi:GntR family transcriptional regulator, transcriptional repressor for pyruvate dehydrogenase complex